MEVRRNRGFTLVELLVSLVIIGTLSAVLLGRLAYYQETAERIAMETTVRLIKTGLQIRLAELIIRSSGWNGVRPTTAAFTMRTPPPVPGISTTRRATSCTSPMRHLDWKSAPAPAARSFGSVPNCSRTGFQRPADR
jgi:prepilin-type N-terminal cleavage/methylation domain-containing protein